MRLSTRACCAMSLFIMVSCVHVPPYEELDLQLYATCYTGITDIEYKNEMSFCLGDKDSGSGVLKMYYPNTKDPINIPATAATCNEKIKYKIDRKTLKLNGRIGSCNNGRSLHPFQITCNLEAERKLDCELKGYEKRYIFKRS